MRTAVRCYLWLVAVSVVFNLLYGIANLDTEANLDALSGAFWTFVLYRSYLRDWLNSERQAAR